MAHSHSPIPSHRRTLGLLRALIREAAKGMDDIDPDQGMALAVTDSLRSRYYVLYRAGFMLKLLARWEEEARVDVESSIELPATPEAREKWIEGAVSDYMREATSSWQEPAGGQIRDSRYPIVAVIKVFTGTGRSKTYPQWGASTVEISAADPGWGPFIYDIVMSQEGGLTADRASVRPAAKHVWTQYKNARPDVKAKPLDDPKNPRTKTMRDDTSRFHPDDAPPGKLPENPLNYAYFLESGPDVSSLVSMHRQADPILRKWGVNIENMAAEFFRVMYHE